MAHKQVPRIILRGDQERASYMSREGMRQLDILKNLMGFQGLKQDVRKIRYTDGSEIICRSVFGIEDVQIYVPKVIEAEIFECFIELLTYGIEGDCVNNLNYIPGGMWNEESCIKEKGFCLTPDEECNIELKPTSHPWREKRNHHVSQCRYVYTEGKITRKVSLFHYDSYPTLLTIPVYKIIRVKGHQNSPDLVLKFLMSEDIEVHYYGALSKDLKTLYVSLFVKKFGILPRQEWYMDYSKYENIDGKWECTKSGVTPKGIMPFRDNAIDRLGRCGCWHYDDEFTDYDHETQGVNCLVVKDGWRKDGTRAEAKYKTFDIETETFIETEKVVGLHLNPVTEEFVTCKALPGTNYFYKLANGAPNQFTLSIFSCHCTPCPDPYSWHTATHDRSVDYKVFFGGWSREYTLFSGLETYPPLWDTFFYDGLQVNKKTAHQLVGNCPTFVPGRNHTCDGTASDFSGGEMRALNVPFTSCVYAGHVKVGTETVESGYAYSPPSWISGVPCNDLDPPIWVIVPHMSPCGHNIESVTQDVDVNEMEMLSPFEMTLQAGDQIGNTFISYDEETDYLLRGIHYKPLGGEWTWKIYARLLGHEGSPYECREKDITNELKKLLSEEYFYNIETIIFTGEAS